jgi:hypothetical protein
MRASDTGSPRLPRARACSTTPAPARGAVLTPSRHARALDEIADRLAGDLLALRLGGLEMRRDLVDDDELRCVEEQTPRV